MQKLENFLKDKKHELKLMDNYLLMCESFPLGSNFIIEYSFLSGFIKAMEISIKHYKVISGESKKSYRWDGQKYSEDDVQRKTKNHEVKVQRKTINKKRKS